MITDYLVVFSCRATYSNAIEDLNAFVQDALAGGWEPFGPHVITKIDGEYAVSQTLISREPRPSLPTLDELGVKVSAN